MFIKKLTFYLSGLAILTLGSTLTIRAKLGTGPWDSLNVGLAESVGLTVGGCSILIGVLLILLNAIIAKKMPDVGGVFTVTISGLFIDVWLLLVLPWYVPASLLTRGASLAVGIILISFGIATYLQAKWSPSPVDDLMVALRERYHVSLGVAKTIGEVLALTIAILIKGPVGIGTLLIALGIGPFITFFHRTWENLTQRN